MSTQGKVGRVTKITKALESLLVMVIFLSHVPKFEAEAENEMAGKSFTAFTLCLSGQTISRYISQRKFISGFNIESVEIKPGVKAKAPEGSYERYENNPNGISFCHT